MHTKVVDITEDWISVRKIRETTVPNNPVRSSLLTFLNLVCLTDFL